MTHSQNNRCNLFGVLTQEDVATTKLFAQQGIHGSALNFVKFEIN